MDEKVDILQPPMFEPTGIVKTKRQAWDDEDWIGTFNLWIVQRHPVPSLVYQQRGPKSSWAPGLLDVPVGGHYQAGEKLADGLREAKEELGKTYTADQIYHLGRKIYVGPDEAARTRHNVVDVYIVEDNSPLQSYQLEEREVYAVCACPLEDLLKAHRDPTYRFEVEAMTATGNEQTITISQASFPYNWDQYHYKMAVLADRLIKGEPDLLY